MDRKTKDRELQGRYKETGATWYPAFEITLNFLCYIKQPIVNEVAGVGLLDRMIRY